MDRNNPFATLSATVIKKAPNSLKAKGFCGSNRAIYNRILA